MPHALAHEVLPFLPRRWSTPAERQRQLLGGITAYHGVYVSQLTHDHATAPLSWRDGATCPSLEEEIHRKKSDVEPHLLMSVFLGKRFPSNITLLSRRSIPTFRRN